MTRSRPVRRSSGDYNGLDTIGKKALFWLGQAGVLAALMVVLCAGVQFGRQWTNEDLRHRNAYAVPPEETRYVDFLWRTTSIANFAVYSQSSFFVDDGLPYQIAQTDVAADQQFSRSRSNYKYVWRGAIFDPIFDAGFGRWHREVFNFAANIDNVRRTRAKILGINFDAIWNQRVWLTVSSWLRDNQKWSIYMESSTSSSPLRIEQKRLEAADNNQTASENGEKEIYPVTWRDQVIFTCVCIVIAWSLVYAAARDWCFTKRVYRGWLFMFGALLAAETGTITLLFGWPWIWAWFGGLGLRRLGVTLTRPASLQPRAASRLSRLATLRRSRFRLSRIHRRSVQHPL